MTDKKDIKPRFVAVRFDETQYWTDDVKSRVKSIHGHYLFDENLVTHCCEITPSYWLRFVGFDLEMEDPDTDIPDELYDIVHGGYHNGDDNDSYRHCRDIDRIEEGKNKKIFMEGDDLEPWAEGYGYEKVFDEVIEAWNANPLW